MTGPAPEEPAAPSILHVDMDAFYVAVEIKKDSTLAGRPVIVGGTGNRGVVASCSYEARAYGIHSAMPTARARRLCPQAVFLPGHFDDYQEASSAIHRIFLSFTPLVEGIALDEAFLDVSGARRLFGSGPEVAARIRHEVRHTVGIECSVGVARTKLMAKLASKEAKPRPSPSGPQPGPGIFVVTPEEELAFLHPKSVRALWGVGPATAARLTRMGISSVGDLARAPLESLVGSLGQAAGHHLHELAWGRDPRRVEPSRPTKSIGHEETYAKDHYRPEALAVEVVRMSDSVAARLRHASLEARTVTLKVRYGDFSTITRSRTEPAGFTTAQVVSRIALALLEEVDVSAGVRLLGVSVSGLGDAGAEQLSLDDLATAGADDAGWKAATSAIDDIRRRFGDTAVGPATLTAPDGLRVKRIGDTQWGPGETAGGGAGAPAVRRSRGAGDPAGEQAQ
ncbi:MAG TPA: DNA polymerase IV [Acidimicrobiales bacterium]|nr:DNA polymerase IV [Acidimicrobiales bacterium]